MTTTTPALKEHASLSLRDLSKDAGLSVRTLRAYLTG